MCERTLNSNRSCLQWACEDTASRLAGETQPFEEGGCRECTGFEIRITKDGTQQFTMIVSRLGKVPEIASLSLGSVPAQNDRTIH